LQGLYVKYFVREQYPALLKRLKVNATTGRYIGATSFHSYQLQRELEDAGIFMARSKSQNRQANDAKPKLGKLPTEWVNYRLSEADTPIILEDAEDYAALTQRLLELFARGVGFSVRYNADRGNWSAFAIAGEGSSDTAPIGISAFGGTQWQAISSLLFKCDVYANRPDAFAKSGQSLGIG